jgi:hypothetical protein
MIKLKIFYKYPILKSINYLSMMGNKNGDNDLKSRLTPL